MRRATTLLHTGRDPQPLGRPVNTPVVRASTILQDDIESLTRADTAGAYGANGTETTKALEEAACEVYGAAGARAVGSGLAACAFTILSFCKAGDRVLLSDAAYGPTRMFCERFAARYGVETAFFDPCVGAKIDSHMTADTRLVFCESPSSVTFEVMDLPAVVDAAHAQGALVALDDAWSGGWFLDPFALGVDVAVQPATKYWGGHADALVGVIACKAAAHFEEVDRTLRLFGLACPPDDAWLTLRGLRTMDVRLQRHEQNALLLASRLADRLDPGSVRHPGLRESPDHTLWKRDFSGSSGLFSFSVDGHDKAKQICDAFKLFGKGYSWGGYESLATVWTPGARRATGRWPQGLVVIRLHAGLEDAEDLWADLDQALSGADL